MSVNPAGRRIVRQSLVMEVASGLRGLNPIRSELRLTKKNKPPCFAARPIWSSPRSVTAAHKVDATAPARARAILFEIVDPMVSTPKMT
jgi:hypothetical protein